MDKIIYQVEDDIDFYAELQKETAKDTCCDTCMITNEPLGQHFVKLACGHTFNYVSIYNDAVQLRRMSHMGLRDLKFYEIQCPYCRGRTGNILPFVSELKLPRRHGINWVDVKKLDLQKGMSVSCLSYLPEGQCDWMDGDNKCTANHVIKNAKSNVQYCFRHHERYVENLKSEERRRRRLERANIKIQQHTSVVATALPHTTPTCIAILKSGKRVGEQCGNIAKVNGMFCLRHNHQ